MNDKESAAASTANVKEEKRPGVRRNIANGYSSRKPTGVHAGLHASRRDTHRGLEHGTVKDKGKDF
jgi:hypothetical protein